MKHDVEVIITIVVNLHEVEAENPEEAEELALKEVKDYHRLKVLGWPITIKEENAYSSESYE